MREIPENLEQELEQGRRIVGIGYYGGIWTEENVLPSRIPYALYRGPGGPDPKECKEDPGVFQRTGSGCKNHFPEIM